MQNLFGAFKALQFGGAMVYPLAILGLVALFIVIDKAFVYWRYGRAPTELSAVIERYHFPWEEMEKHMASLPPGSYFCRFFRVILDNRAHPHWWIESRAGNESQVIEKGLNRGLWVLETIVTAAPLLGLVGTIVGMMDSFKMIGGSGIVNPTGITGGVAQALIATTLGLIIALIALFAFNFFSHLQSRTIDQMERLGTNLIDRIRMDQMEGSHIGGRVIDHVRADQMEGGA
jgi:biopolymer transport protein ExbB